MVFPLFNLKSTWKRKQFFGSTNILLKLSFLDSCLKIMKNVRSNINEVIRAVLNFFFFLRKDFVCTKSTKSTKKDKKHKNTTKQKHKMQISEQKFKMCLKTSKRKKVICVICIIRLFAFLCFLCTQRKKIENKKLISLYSVMY